MFFKALKEHELFVEILKLYYLVCSTWGREHFGNFKNTMFEIDQPVFSEKRKLAKTKVGAHALYKCINSKTRLDILHESIEVNNFNYLTVPLFRLLRS